MFDTAALALHNTIHAMFQSPRHLFRQIGFLLYAETSYQVSTGQQLPLPAPASSPQVDATYFGEHAHIDIHHSQMVIEEVVAPLVARFTAEFGTEVILGAELTRAAFDAAWMGICWRSAGPSMPRRQTVACSYGQPAGRASGGHALATPDAPGDRRGPGSAGSAVLPEAEALARLSGRQRSGRRD